MVSIKPESSFPLRQATGNTVAVAVQQRPYLFKGCPENQIRFSGNIPGQKFRQMAVGLKPHFFQNLHRHETFYRFTLLKNLTQRRKERN
jgi:hypothetical protein